VEEDPPARRSTRAEGLLFDAYRTDEYPPRSIQAFLSANPAPTRPSIRDLRRGWVVTQIEAGIPTGILVQVGGFSSAGALDAYVGYIKDSLPEAFFTALANAGSR